ncbi:hillarin [Chironomus tepperi]|uniref:hillarin n=1 Tax=Chironomus tepperi TaxID=113505 RepID=UPI00391F4AA4
MYRPNFYESTCLRCSETVYQVDRIGPLKDFTFYHTGCFKCKACGSKLTLKTYFNNQLNSEDKEVYCSSHVPKSGPGHFDQNSVGIRQALNVPKSTNLINDQIRGTSRDQFDGVQRQMTPNGHNGNGNSIRDHVSPSYNDSSDYKYGRFDASALHIAHALKQTEIQKSYNKAREKPIDQYLAREEQARLEMKHRKEEDDLYRRFAKKREDEERRMQNEIQDEWERELQRLTHKFEKEISTKRSRDEQNVLTLRHQQQKDDLEKNMTLRKTKKKESLTRKILESERSETAALVDKQSSEMLDLISARRSEYMQSESIFLDDDEYPNSAEYPLIAPKPAPPLLSKFQIYADPVEFHDVDQIAISVAQNDQKTFTDLVRQLIAHCTSDVEKARTIFRWITVKNLNTMHFDDDLRGDTPMGLLRGIKYGTESYHVLFKRLCSYAGLHCVVIKGYSKSAGYQPGVKFQDSRFRNSWNAVYVAGAWRFVQCNWGARHLVNAKEAPKTSKGKNDSLRYEYDDHYFLTDPREFIYEFFPLQEEWQLLKRPISLREFENLPFVRSLFFRYGLHFADEGYGAVVYTDDTGAATVRIAMPNDMQSCLIFHYNLKFYDSDEDSFDAVSLKRFVMQSVIGNIVAFRVHAPCSGAFLLDIFANAVTPQEYLTGEPMKFKSVCKFKICCEELQTVMVPLPDCASGEWGPTKATRLFGLIPITHQEPLIFASRVLEIQFRMSRALTDFMATLHKNGIEEKKLSKFVQHAVIDDTVTFTINFPEEGQYGLDIYTREVGNNMHHNSSSEKHLLTHCCKYLINSSRRN